MKSNDNFATEGLSGKYKQVVFRQRFGNTVVTKSPKRKAPYSAQQQLVASTFRNASVYAKSVLTDPAIKDAYKAKAKVGSSAYNRAIADFFKAPEISELDTSGYNGQVGSTVIAVVTDDFKVSSVKCRIELADGSLLEEGQASLLPDGLRWMYVSVGANNTVAGTKISFIAEDMPAHSTIKSKTI